MIEGATLVVGLHRIKHYAGLVHLADICVPQPRSPHMQTSHPGSSTKYTPNPSGSKRPKINLDAGGVGICTAL